MSPNNIPNPPPSGSLPQVSQADLSDMAGIPAINQSEVEPNDLTYKEGIPKITIRPPGQPVKQGPLGKETASAQGGITTPMPPQGDVVTNYAAQIAAQQPDPIAALDARFAPQGTPQVQPTPPIKTSIGTNLDNAFQQAHQQDMGQSFGSRLMEAAKGGITQSLNDFQGKLPSEDKDYEQPFSTADLGDLKTAATKAVYQLAHGAPVLAGGIGGGVAGGIVGGPPGAAAGGALGAGAISAAQGLNQYFQSALKTNPDPEVAFNQALKQAGTAGAFTSAGWLAFGMTPFTGAVKNLLFQAAGVQPAIGAAGQVAQNAESGRPLGEGTGQAAASSSIMTALPAMAHTVVHALTGSPEAATQAQGIAENLTKPVESKLDEQGLPVSEPEFDKTAETVKAQAEEHVTRAERPNPPVNPLGEDSPLSFRFNEGAKTKMDKENTDRMMDYLNGKTGENPVQSSTLHWNNPLTRDTLTKLASYLPEKEIHHDEAVRAAAYSLGMSVEDMISKGTDQIFNDKELAALKMARDAMGGQIQELAKQATTTNSEADWNKFLAAAALSRDLESVYSYQGTETARALRQRRGDIKLGDNDYNPEILKLISGTQSDNDLRQVASRVAMLDSPEKVAPFLQRLNNFFSRDNIVNGWYQMLLSNPEILGKKQGSDLLMLARDLSSDFIAEKTGNIPPGATLFKLNSIIRSHQDAFRAFAKAWKEGQSQYGSSFADVSQHSPEFYENLQNANVPHDTTSPDEQTPEQTFLGTLKANIPWPTRVIGALDDMNKVFRERGSLAEQLYTQGYEKGLRGDELKSYTNENMSNPSYRMQRIAEAEAQRGTLQEPMGPLASQIASFVDQANIPLYRDIQIPVGKFILPFVRIASNTMREAYRLNPLSAFSAEFSNLNGTAKAKAAAVMGLGTAFSLSAVPWIANGTITGGGPSNPELRKAWLQDGNEPYSIKIGSKRYGYRWVEPLGFMLGMQADTMETIKYASESDASDLAMSFVRGTGSALLNASYLGSVAQFFDSILSKNPQQSSGRWWNNLVASMSVPQGVNMVAQGIDPYMREHKNLMDTIQARLPYLSEHLQPVLDTWGNPVKNKEHLVRGLIPMTVTDATGGNVQPIDKWIWDNYKSFPKGTQGDDGISKPARTFTQGSQGAKASVQLNPEQYTEYQKLAGHGAKDENGLGAVDYLNALVKGTNPDNYAQDQWDEGSDEKKALMVSHVMNVFRTGYDAGNTGYPNVGKSAKEMIMDKYPEIQRALDMQLQSKQQRLQQ